MKYTVKSLVVLVSLVFVCSIVQAQTPYYDKTGPGYLVFHPIKTDQHGQLLPWFSDDEGAAYSHVILSVWDFWDNMRTDYNGLPYYMNHQVWRPKPNDPRGIGGDQFSMALSSWQLLYQYTGNENIRENMKFLTEYYLSHGMSPDNASWPNLPFPYNTLIYSGLYDGDMVEGKDITQPDKAGSFGHELVKMYKLTQKKNYQTITTQYYLDAAIRIANTLSAHTVQGNENNSPLPFKVNAYTGHTAHLKSNTGDQTITGYSSYTTNWSGTLELFEELINLRKGNTEQYQKAFDLILKWMKQYPLKNNKWGPFFEDIPGFSNTQINAITFARFILDHRQLFPDWKSDVQRIFNWTYKNMGNSQWAKYGVIVMNEQTAYQTPGNSHTSRQAATELLYTALSGDTSYRDNAIRALNWATYSVDNDGKNNYPKDEVWLTDGYGDYVRHFLRAMASDPELAPGSENHILSSTSIVNEADYYPDFNKTLTPDLSASQIKEVKIYYRTFDNKSVETIRMSKIPQKVVIGEKMFEKPSKSDEEGWRWVPLTKGGVLTITHWSDNQITIY